MPAIKLTVTKGDCRCGYHREGDTFLVGDLCPPLCHELWNVAYPYIFALMNGADLDCGEHRLLCFDAACPDGARVMIHGESVVESEKDKILPTP